MCTAPLPVRSTTWSRRWASKAASPSQRSPGSVRSWTLRWLPSAAGRWPTPASLCVRGRHLPQGQGEQPGGVASGGHCHWGHRRRRPRGARLRSRRQRKRRVLDRVPALAQGSRARWVQLVVSDAHTGLKQAIAAVLAGACWQRCRVHFFRNTLARVLKTSAEMVAVTIRTIFAQLTPAEVADQVDKVATTLQPRFPTVAALLVEEIGRAS